MNSTQPSACGLIAWLENTRIALPLKGVEVHFDVRGDLVSVELRQIYHQDHRKPLDVLYSFPLPGGAAVHRCEMVVNDRVISAKVMELVEARRVVAEKKAAGHRTALVESVRENLFELALGNLAPGDTVAIHLAWFQTLDTAGNDRSFRIPFTPGVRYIPGIPLLRSNSGKGTADDTNRVPDASRLLPPRIDQLHPDAAWVSVEGVIQLEDVDVARITSPSHTLILSDFGQIFARLSDTGEVPDRDFVLHLPASSPATLTSIAWTAHDGSGHVHALARIIAPATAPATEVPRDVYFLVDRSGSMEGAKWTATCQAFRAFLDNLAAHDLVWVTFFESSFRDLAERPLPPRDIMAEPVVNRLESWPVGGGTELLPALDHVLAAMEKHSPGRNPAIILITDGQVGNEQEVIARMKRLPEVRMFCYGIDTAVNDAFLRRLAAQQRGFSVLATPQENLVGSVAGLAARLRHPVFTGIQPPDGWELPAGTIPDLHAGECLTVSLRAPSFPKPPLLNFTAKDVNGAPATLTCPAHAAQDPEIASVTPAIACLWAKERIEFLLAENNRLDAIELSVRANIICQLTAFVAWDAAERIVITGPNREVYQPAMEVFAGGSPRRGRSQQQALYAVPAVFDEPDIAAEPAASPPPAPALHGERPVSYFQASYCLMSGDLDELGEWDDSPGPAFPSSGPLIGRRGKSLRERLLTTARKGSLFLSDAMLDILEQWLRSDPDKIPAREALLEDLAVAMAANTNPWYALVQWLKANFEPGLFGTAHEEAKRIRPEYL